MKIITGMIGKKRWIILLVVIGVVGITTAAMLPKNSPIVVAENYNEEEIQSSPTTGKLKNEGIIYVSLFDSDESELDGATIFLLQKKGEKFIPIKESIGSPFKVEIGHIYKVMAKKEGYLTSYSRVLVFDTPEQMEEVRLFLRDDPSAMSDRNFLTEEEIGPRHTY